MHDMRFALGHDTRIARGHDTRIARGHDMRIARGHDMRIARGYDTRIASGHDTRIARGHDTRIAPCTIHGLHRVRYTDCTVYDTRIERELFGVTQSHVVARQTRLPEQKKIYIYCG